ncbi:MAG TPA: universal stress protein [Ktedonobacteraceae bacterium]|nr:universal stress protein [Ktedonobacteraceae bacterium]
MDSQRPDEHQWDKERPKPEDLLERYHLRAADGEDDDASTSADAQPTKQRGRLRVYLGAAAGVGKTYAMLNEGRRRKERGTDVVVGYVETHKRVQTQAQLGDLEVLPRKKVDYRGVVLEEMDTEAVIARHPAVVLVDELAHTNVAGSQHAKRYQDVLAILDAGIHVITTLNVQHLESLNDLVKSITGIQVRETLPDRILDQADEVELIDIAPSALRQRMRHGNVYAQERVGPALDSFFREGNLTALRELALRLTADKTESQLQQYMTEHKIAEQWSTTERVLVGFDHRPQSRRVIRDAWRLAHGLHADLIALYVEPEGYPALLRRVNAMLRDGPRVRARRQDELKRLEEHITLAEDLGAEVVRRKSPDIARALAEVARQQHITQIVLGQPAHTQWEVLLFGSVTNRLLRLITGVDVHLVPWQRERKRNG